MSRRLAIMPLMFIVSSLFGQEHKKDTLLYIDDITVIGKTPVGDRVGNRITRIEEKFIEYNNTRSMSELLEGGSTIQIKSMGQGAMSTASFRGTSSNHTQVLWNGINLNSPTLGSFDFSTVPIFFTDGISLSHGSGANNSGSGSLGGTVEFITNSRSVDKPEIKFISEYGSNNTFSEALSVRATLGSRFTTATRLFIQQSDNDYRYINNVFSKESFYERRKNAEYRQIGAMQEFYYKLKSNSDLSAIIWWHNDKRSLPQPIIVDKSAKEEMLTDNIRSQINYSISLGKHIIKTTAAFMNSSSDYRRSFEISIGDTVTTSKNNSFISRVEHSVSLGDKVDLSNNIQYRYDRVNSSNYSFGKISRNTFHAKSAATIRATRAFHLGVWAMAEVTDGEIAPTYNVSLRYRLLKELLAVKASNSYNFRIPTLNDLYWQPGGNPDLKPEEGFSWDASLNITPSIGSVKFEIDATYYIMNINNWIMWIPKGNGYIWEPSNFSKVRSQGVEISGKASTDLGKTSHKVSVNYGFAHSVDRSNRGDGTDSKQLPYIPRNKWNVWYNFTLKGLWLNYNASFTDIRYTSADQSYFTPAYIVHNAELGYKKYFTKGRSASVSMKVDNIANAYYESTQYYPMPLRMFSARLQLMF